MLFKSLLKRQIVVVLVVRISRTGGVSLVCRLLCLLLRHKVIRRRRGGGLLWLRCGVIVLAVAVVIAIAVGVLRLILLLLLPAGAQKVYLVSDDVSCVLGRSVFTGIFAGLYAADDADKAALALVLGQVFGLRPPGDAIDKVRSFVAINAVNGDGKTAIRYAGACLHELRVFCKSSD